LQRRLRLRHVHRRAVGLRLRHRLIARELTGGRIRCRPLSARSFLTLPVFDDALRRVATRERERIGRLLRALTRARLAIDVRRLRARRRFERRTIDARLHEHELRAIARLLRNELNGFGLSKNGGEPLRRQEDHDDHHQVKDDGQQHHLEPGQRAPDRSYVRVVILEIEIHQGVTSIAGAPRSQQSTVNSRQLVDTLLS